MTSEHALELYSRKYGYYSVAALLLKYSSAVEALNGYVEAAPAHPVSHDARVQTTLACLRDHYRVSVAQAPSYDHTKHISVRTVDGIALTSYDVEAFRARDGRDRQAESCTLATGDAAGIISNAFYIYAIGPDMTVRLSRDPFLPEHVLLGVRDDLLTHAHLVADAGLTCAAAGETIFVKRDERVAAAIISNKSGHFRPKPESLRTARRVFADLFGIAEAMVFAVSVER